MAPYAALYGRRCRSPVGWFEVGEAALTGPDSVLDAMEKVQLIRERLKTAQSRQKSYADVRRRELEFQVDDGVFLIVSPMKWVMRFGKKGKLSPRYVGPYRILKRIGGTHGHHPRTVDGLTVRPADQTTVRGLCLWNETSLNQPLTQTTIDQHGPSFNPRSVAATTDVAFTGAATAACSPSSHRSESLELLALSYRYSGWLFRADVALTVFALLLVLAGDWLVALVVVGAAPLAGSLTSRMRSPLATLAASSRYSRRRKGNEKEETEREGEKGERGSPGLQVAVAASHRNWTENEREEEDGRRIPKRRGENE
ncbi:hypothetical protein MTR67_052062 [Solanum verrucosum]|uniref:Tf2-1-like SH3-like domain-containing protein n=1 Tax=Solanum verrucosum TaxID=315347 RepID=A0AAF0V671_SOLVR|nr:hypothetical protein MTR67_052062 [Solanum verrucosum]